MGVHFWNRKQLLADLDISIAAQARELLKENGVDVQYLTKRGEDSVVHTKGTSASNSRYAYPKTWVHLLYVHRKDFANAKEILRQSGLI